MVEAPNNNAGEINMFFMDLNVKHFVAFLIKEKPSLKEWESVFIRGFETYKKLHLNVEFTVDKAMEIQEMIFEEEAQNMIDYMVASGQVVVENRNGEDWVKISDKEKQK